MEFDKAQTWTDVTKEMTVEDIDGASRDGACIIGLNVQGASWDTANEVLERSKSKEIFSKMPIINVRALASDKVSQGIYVCPTYKTVFRGPTFVFCAPLKSKASAEKWVLAGVALIMDVN